MADTILKLNRLNYNHRLCFSSILNGKRSIRCTSHVHNINRTWINQKTVTYKLNRNLGLDIKCTYVATRYFGVCQRRAMQLADGVTQKEWDTKFWASREATKASSHRSILTKLFERNKWFRKSPIEIRGMYFVILKDGAEFTHAPDQQTTHQRLLSDDVLATTYVTDYQQQPVIIPYRYVSSTEWGTLIEPFLKVQLYSASMTYTAIMEVITLRSKGEIKYDTSLDAQINIGSPLVQSFLDYLLTEERIEHAQRALMNYMEFCHVLKRKDLVENAYGKAKDMVKIFSSPFMVTSLLVLQNTIYDEDIYRFSDILYHWVGEKDRYLLASCACVALRHGNFETAFKYIASSLTSDGKGRSEAPVSKFIEMLLDTFRYSDDPVRWRFNRGIVEQFIAFMAKARFFPHTRSVLDIENWFKSIGNESWQSGHYNFSEIKYNYCPLSGAGLRRKSLTDDEYHYLAKVVMREILGMTHSIDEGGHILATGFSRTDKREVKSFLTMLYEEGPFDLVVDGMNVYYFVASNVPGKEREQSTTMTVAWLRHLISERERRLGRKLNLLVVFKNHMRMQFQDMLDNVAKVWFTSDDAEDDMFFLYAAILCGRQCNLFTLDLMTDFRARVCSNFDAVTSNLVYKWQQLHQDLHLLKMARRMTPQVFDVSIQRTNSTWHIPYTDDGIFPSKWLMLKDTGKS